MILLLFSITCFIISGIILILSKTIENRERKSSSYKYTKGNIDWVPGADQWIDTDAFFDSRSGMINHIFISGLAHHCSIQDCGIFGGIIYNDKDNPVEKKAMAIRSYQSKKVIGYVPAAILDDYRKWCGRKECHCVGFLYRQEGKLRGRVRVYHPDCDLELIEKDGAQYLEKVCEIFGWEIPSGEFKI